MKVNNSGFLSCHSQVMESKSCVVLETILCYCTSPPLLAIPLSTQVHKVDISMLTLKAQISSLF